MAHWIRKGVGNRFGPGYGEFAASHQMEANRDPGFGVRNPGPSLPIQGFKSSAVDEMLNANDADGTSTAQYTPAVHTLQAQVGNGNGHLKPKFYPEGTVFMLEGMDGGSGDWCQAKVWTSGDSAPQGVNPTWVLVLAADVDAKRQSGKFVFMPFATRGVQTVLLGKDAARRFRPCSDLYLTWHRVGPNVLGYKLHDVETEQQRIELHARYPFYCAHRGVVTLDVQRGDSSVSVCLL